METLDPDKLPYPGAALAITARSGRWEMVNVSDAIAAGTAQWPQAYLQRGGRVEDSEGVLSLWGDAVAFYADSGSMSRWHYHAIKSYSVKG
jgi:hypothetical protein